MNSLYFYLNYETNDIYFRMQKKKKLRKVLKDDGGEI